MSGEKEVIGGGDQRIFIESVLRRRDCLILDAAKKKPTYIVEHDEPLIRGIYEDVWTKATPIV